MPAKESILSQLRGQFDLFDEDPGHREVARRPRKKIASDPTSTELSWHSETAVRLLEESGNFKVLRRLTARPTVPRDDSFHKRIGVLVDTETTGLNHKIDEVIEIGVVAFAYGDDGSIGDVIGVYSGLRQPSMPIPPEITRLTGITDQMVEGQQIDLLSVEALIEPADLVIAHNAGFDRPFCEQLTPAFAPKAWACSVTEIPWADLGFEGSKLGYLVGQSGFFHEGHRATDDCHALLEVLARPLADTGGNPFTYLLRSSEQSRVRIFAEHAPFDMKDHLKARGYRWSDGSDGKPRAWWIEVADDRYDDELLYLRTEIYRWEDADPLTIWLGATERFRR